MGKRCGSADRQRAETIDVCELSVVPPAWDAKPLKNGAMLAILADGSCGGCKACVGGQEPDQMMVVPRYEVDNEKYKSAWGGHLEEPLKIGKVLWEPAGGIEGGLLLRAPVAAGPSKTLLAASAAELPELTPRSTAMRLCYAAACGDSDAATQLLAARADVNGKNYDLRSALHIAAAQDAGGGMVTLLLQHRADVNALDAFGRTPLTEAQQKGNSRVEKMLVKSGARLLLEKLQINGGQAMWTIQRSEVTITSELSRTLKSSVHRATWRGLDVVAKFALEEEEKEEEKETAAQELLNEINILASLRHPDLVMFLGACLDVTSGPVMFMLPFMPGGDLDNYYRKRRQESQNRAWKPDLPLVRRWASAIARALCFLHNCPRPIVHRDLKPMNLLLSESLELKVTDFGISKMSSGKKLATKGDHGSADSLASVAPYMTGGVGTWLYMAPEVTRHEHYSEKADIYSFALILYFMSSGRQPFHELQVHATDILDQYSLGKEPRPRLTDCPPALRPIIKNAWIQNPAERPSAALMTEQLSKVAAAKRGCGVM